MTTNGHDDKLIATLRRLSDLLDAIDSPRAPDVARLIARHAGEPDVLIRAVNANSWWAGAGSLAAETMADNPGLPEDLWRQEVRSLRELLTEIGEELISRGGENPGISSWILAFHNWTAAGY